MRALLKGVMMRSEAAGADVSALEQEKLRLTAALEAAAQAHCAQLDAAHAQVTTAHPPVPSDQHSPSALTHAQPLIPCLCFLSPSPTLNNRVHPPVPMRPATFQPHAVATTHSCQATTYPSHSQATTHKRTNAETATVLRRPWCPCTSGHGAQATSNRALLFECETERNECESERSTIVLKSSETERSEFLILASMDRAHIGCDSTDRSKGEDTAVGHVASADPSGEDVQMAHALREEAKMAHQG